MGKVIGGVIGGLVGGPWGVAIGVGLGHMVDSSDDSGHVNTARNTTMGDTFGQIADVNVRTGRFNEINPGVDVVWAQVGIEISGPGSLNAAMAIVADGQPVRALHPDFQGPDGEVLVMSNGHGYEYGNRVDFDIVIPISTMDIPQTARRIQAVIFAFNNQGIVDTQTIDLALKGRRVSGQSAKNHEDIVNVLWGAVIADGQVDRLEAREVRRFLERELGLSAFDMQEIKAYLHKVNLTTAQALDSARKIATAHDQQMKNRLLDLVVEIIAADGRVTDDEEAYVMDLGRIFGLSENDLDRIFDAHHSAGRLRALMVLGLGTDATKEEISKRFKELALKYHPDRLMDMDPDFQRLGAAKFTRVKQAYDRLTGK